MLCIAVPGASFAGAWTSEPLHSWHKLSFNYYSSDQMWDDNGDFYKTETDFTDINFAYYGQLGLTGWLDVWTSLSYKRLKTELGSASIESSGLGDVDIALKGRFLHFKDTLVMSGQYVLTMPWFYNKNDELPLGDGMADHEIKALMGISLYPIPIYLGAEGGYKIREGFQSNVWTYLLEGGVTIWKIYLREKLDGWSSAEGTDMEAEVSRSVAQDSALGRLESTLGFQIIKWIGVEASYTYQMWGRNTSKGNTFGIGVTGSF